MNSIRQYWHVSSVVLLAIVVASATFAGVGAGVVTDSDSLDGSAVTESPSDVTNASLSIADHTQPGQVGQERVTVSGTSNREDGTTIFVEVLGADGTVVTSAEATVNGTSNTWATTLDLTDVEPGPYTVRASDDETTATLDFEVVNTLNTPAETPVETETDTDTATATEFPSTPEPTESPTEPTPDTETDTAGAGTTPTQTPGFGALAVFGAFATLMLVGWGLRM